MYFREKVVIVTGAGGGIGAQTALHLAKLGSSVSIVDIDENNLLKLAQEITEAGYPKPLSIIADITKDPERIINDTVSHFGRLDVLVNNAGIAKSDMVSNFDASQFDHMINVNLRSAIILTNLAVPHLEKTQGNIVNVSSITGLRAYDHLLSYGISKSGLNLFTKCAAIEFASKGIRVNAVNPGMIRTKIHLSGEKDSDAFFEDKRKSVLIGRIGETSDVSSAIAYLASEPFVNGILHVVDGGGPNPKTKTS